ncbi:MAG TPA: NAD(P)/FAD-dependent oxidoreductase [Anaeromyxobacteraceae bacterium]|nr:NAD(P)/FAD-dependent oxidoreductase [Anaeromyxobacteraceae bacterium]
MAPGAVEAEVVVVGAGPAGLAVGACLRRAGIPFLLLEKEEQVGAIWRRHYDRLHLHTDRGHSALPFLPFPKSYPRYASRQQVVDYLQAYARAFDLAPRFGEGLVAARRAARGWEVETRSGRYRARAVVLATGFCAEPVRPRWPGLETYRGTVLHSSEYRSGEPFRGRDVLVVGLGNSGGEIAIDLVEHGARPALSVRGPVNLLPLELFGLPILTWSLALSRLPPRLADAIARPLLRAALGDPTRLGFARPAAGPMRQIRERARIPLIDVGTLALVEAGRIAVRPGIDRFSAEGVVFAGGARARFDAVVLATGYRHALERVVEGAEALVDDDGRPRASGRESALPGLYLCGFHVAPTGMLREIGLEARRIAADLARGRAARRRGG